MQNATRDSMHNTVERKEQSAKETSLFQGRRFLPLFVTQFFGSFNDNAFKNALLIWFTYGVCEYYGMDASIMVSLAAALFILPFFLFSATAGQLADKYEKSRLTKYIKFFEILLMLLCSIFFFLENVMGLLILIFLMGTQSTFFGPIKYSLLPEHLEEKELIEGNAWIEAGTFLSILLGTLFGGLIILTEYGITILSLALFLFAIIGYMGSVYIPKTSIPDPNLVLNFNIFTQTRAIICFAKKNRAVWYSINAISWFWLIGATFLTQFPVYAKDIIYGNESIVTLFLALFSIGIGVGSALCNMLTKGKVQTKIVPWACLGISLGIVSFVYSSYWYSMEYNYSIQSLGLTLQKHTDTENLLSLAQLLSMTDFFVIGFSSYVLTCSLLFIAVMAGLFIVPLYAFMQVRADKQHISRIIAANNVMNAVYMVFASLIAIVIFALGFGVLELFLFLAVINIVVFFGIKKIKF